MVAPGSNVTAEVKRPSELDSAEVEAWQNFMTRTPHLQRAFFTHAFARACERAHGRAYVGVLHEDGAPAGFFPFQYAGFWQERIGLAERIGGALSDHSGLIARPGFRIDPLVLLRLCRVAALFIDHLSYGQAEFGLSAEEARPGHVIDLTDGIRSYFAAQGLKKKRFIQDLERSVRKVSQEYGQIEITSTRRPAWNDVLKMIEEKRLQYGRTRINDPFKNRQRLEIIKNMVQDAELESSIIVFTRISAGGCDFASHLGLMYNGHLNYWFPVYNTTVKKFSPGRLLLWKMIASADELDLRWIDCGEGDSHAKRGFSTGMRLFGRSNWRVGGWRSLIAHSWQGVSWRLSR